MLGVTTMLISWQLLVFAETEGFQAVKLMEKVASKGYENSTEFRFASYYQDHMVLQRAPESAIIWGYGSRNGIIAAMVDDEVYMTSVNTGPENAGTWSFTLKPHIEGGPFKISVTQEVNGNTQVITLNDVYYGEVWMCSGQSNMAMPVQVIINSSSELNETYKFPKIRVMQVGLHTSESLLHDLNGISIPWSIPSPKTISSFSAVCWLYGKYLYEKLHIPFGLIQSSWGGTPIETWSSDRALKECDLDDKDSNKTEPIPQKNSIVWNAMIYPLVKMTIKGVIWYQGEQNAVYHCNSYNCSFPAMIRDWRESWYDGTNGITDPHFPFGFVQLSIRNAPNWFDDGNYSMIRWHQTADHGYVPNDKMRNTYMAVTMDLFDDGIPYNSVHPRDKEDVAKRLSLGARRYVYEEDVVTDGPFPQSIYEYDEFNILIQYPKNQKIVVGETQNFQICCIPTTCDVNEPFHGTTWTNATIKQWDYHSVYIPTYLCPQGVNAVRYAWTVSPCQFKKCQVYNKYGLPAAPFYYNLLSSITFL